MDWMDGTERMIILGGDCTICQILSDRYKAVKHARKREREGEI